MGKNRHAQALGKLGGQSKSAKKIAAVRRNLAIARSLRHKGPKTLAKPA